MTGARRQQGVGVRHRFVAGVLSLVTAGALTTVPYAVAAAPIDPIVNYAGQSCDVTLPGGATARVAEQGGHESAQILDAAAVKGGMFSIDSGGHQVLVPADRLTAGVNLSAYDTALLAARQCGWNAPQRPSRASGGYRLAPLTIDTLDLNGQPAPLFVMLTNVDDQGLARPIPADKTVVVFWESSERSGVSGTDLKRPSVRLRDRLE